MNIFSKTKKYFSPQILRINLHQRILDATVHLHMLHLSKQSTLLNYFELFRNLFPHSTLLNTLEVGIDKKEWMSVTLNAQMARADQLIAAAAHGSGPAFRFTAESY
jgi:hypothetical protein